MVGSGPGFVAGTLKTVPVFLECKYVMQIVFSDGKTVNLILESTPLASVYQTIYKHLQHVTIPFRDWDNPFYFENLTHQELVERLIFYGSKVSLNVNRDLCMLQDQNYFNTIHKIYETTYQGDSAWLDFHEHIHACEKRTNIRAMCIDYREKSGMLEKSFAPEWTKNATTKIKAGDVFVHWSELGKTPYSYWKNNEPNDIDRMCELIKPWLKLRPKILVALDDIDTLTDIDIENFEPWWAQYQEVLCKHWNQATWAAKDIFSVSVFGRVPNFEMITTQLKNHVTPVKVLL